MGSRRTLWEIGYLRLTQHEDCWNSSIRKCAVLEANRASLVALHPDVIHLGRWRPPVPGNAPAAIRRKLVGPGLGDGADDASRVSAELRAEGAGTYAKLLDGIHAQQQSRRTGGVGVGTGVAPGPIGAVVNIAPPYDSGWLGSLRWMTIPLHASPMYGAATSAEDPWPTLLIATTL